MKKKVGRPTRFGENHKIIKLIKENPRRKGTKAHENFKLIRDKMKVSTFIKAGGNMRDLRYSVDKGWIKVVDPLG